MASGIRRKWEPWKPTASHLVARLMNGSGMRLLEALTVRVGDINFGYRQITIRSGKGFKDRVTVLPDALIPALKAICNVFAAFISEISRTDSGRPRCSG